MDALPVVEADGLVWIWPGSLEAMTGGPPEVARPPPGFQVRHWPNAVVWLNGWQQSGLLAGWLAMLRCAMLCTVSHPTRS